MSQRQLPKRMSRSQRRKLRRQEQLRDEENASVGGILDGADEEEVGDELDEGVNSAEANRLRQSSGSDAGRVYEGQVTSDKPNLPARQEEKPQAYVRRGLISRLFGRSSDDEPLMPWNRREQKREEAMLSIQRGFDHLSELMGDIRDNLADNVERQGRLLEQLESLPKLAEQGAEANRLHGQTLEQIRRQIDSQREDQSRLHDVLEGYAKGMRDGREAVDELQGRLDRMRQTDQSIADNLSSVGNAVRSVTTAHTAQGEFLAKMTEAMDRRSAEMEQALKKQAGRQTWLLILVLVIALLALAAAGVAGFLYLQSTGRI